MSPSSWNGYRDIDKVIDIEAINLEQNYNVDGEEHQNTDEENS